MELSFQIASNHTPFDQLTFQQREQARTEAQNPNQIYDIWEQWEYGDLDNRSTCDQLLSELRSMPELLELHPRLDGGYWWVQLGGFHMNVHKLLENALFECDFT